ncbi:MAG: carboxypeptidase regulatory-like domain-containing protein [Bacteroidales bacterium]|nr:carboxypeptidase regulatory-like domain-containing protein [Bacteroidales bacterium]
MMKKLLFLFVAMVTSVSLWAQVTSSNISGKVTGAGNEPLAFSTIVATHTAAGIEYSTVADENGNYRLSNVRAGGPYTIQVRMVGYQPLNVEGVYAALGETKYISFSMKEESISLDAVVITAEAISNGMSSERAGATTAISSEEIALLPTVTRSLNDVLSLTPQAASNTSGLAIGGGNYRQSYVTVDGAAFNNAFGIGQNLPSGGSPISLDALEAMTINITPFDVRQSGFTGGAINAITKGGTNEWHATVYDYYYNNDFKGYKVNGQDIPNTYSLNNTIGASVGGPIIKNKLFFFINGEYTKDELPGSANVARTDASQAYGDDVAQNRPTVGQMTEIKNFLANKFGYDPGRYEGYSLSTPDYKIIARLDWNINKNNTFMIRFNKTHVSQSNNPSSSMSPLGSTNTSFSVGGVDYSFNRYSEGRQSSYALPFESSRYFQEQNFLSLAAELNSRIAGGRANNMFRFTWSHQDEPRSFVGDLFPTVDILSTEGCDEGKTAMLTTFGPDPFTHGNLRDVQTIVATDEMTWGKGINNFTAGLQFEWNRTENGFMQGGAGWYIYDSWESFVDDVNGGLGGAKPVLYMLTHPNNNALSQEYPSFDYSQASAYFQDELHISDFFKLTAGLRIEMPFLSNPNNNLNKDFADVAAANPNSSFAGLSTEDLPDNRVNFSPRLGFNWDILKNRNLVLRGGTGIFTGRIPFVWMVSAMGNANVLQNQYIANAKTGLETIHFHQSVADQLQEIYGGTFQQKDLAAPTAATIISKDLIMPSAWKSSLAVDGNLPFGIKGTLEGIYSYNYNEVYATQLGIKKAEQGILLAGEHQEREVWVSEGIKNKENATMGGYYLQNIDKHGNYYSITAQLNKDFEFGLNLMAAYTYAKGKSLSDGTGDQISEFVNTFNVNGSNTPELGYSNYVAPNRVLFNAGYRINEGRYTATNVGLTYEGYNIGYFGGYSYSRISYVMNNVSGTSANQLLYIPTAEDLTQMNFVDEANKAEYVNFIEDDKYLSSHRGEYEERNAIIVPWLNRINFHVSQEFNFYVNNGTKKNTFEIACDVKNIANLLNNEWSNYQVLNTNVVLNYDAENQIYKFTKPEWNDYANTVSTWSISLSARYKF